MAEILEWIIVICGIMAIVILVEIAIYLWKNLFPL